MRHLTFDPARPIDTDRMPWIPTGPGRFEGQVAHDFLPWTTVPTRYEPEWPVIQGQSGLVLMGQMPIAVNRPAATVPASGRPTSTGTVIWMLLGCPVSVELADAVRVSSSDARLGENQSFLLSQLIWHFLGACADFAWPAEHPAHHVENAEQGHVAGVCPGAH